MKYHQHIDGTDEWVAMKNYPVHKIACCECGLVHILTFKKTRNGLEFKAAIDHRATAQKRRHTRKEALVATTPLPHSYGTPLQVKGHKKDPKIR